FHKNWIDNHKNDPEQLTYSKAMDALFKSLREIINRSSDIPKIWKANELLTTCEASINIFYRKCPLQYADVYNKEDTTSSCSSDDLLDRCGFGIHNKEDTTSSCSSDDLLDPKDKENNEILLNIVNINGNENELERHAEETIQHNGKIWIVAFYDIIDLTPGSNSAFMRFLPNDAVHEMKQFGSEELQSAPDNVKELIVKFVK
ncbi:11051_t:CDS:2, partial [Racocetra fulgida]